MTKDVSILHTTSSINYNHYRFNINVAICQVLCLYCAQDNFCSFSQDIAGIVSTIYDSIGKSVTVPHYGSKTIQVRLTVVPDDGKRSQRERREGRRRRRRECPVMTVAPPECVEPSDEEQRDRLSPDDDGSSKSSCSEDRRPVQRQTTYNHPRPHRHPRREPRERKHTKKRSGSLQRRELLEIIQANMEKNHLSFQASR